MTDAPIEVLIAAFQDENEADNVLKQLKADKHEGLIGIKDAAVIRRDENNKVHIKDVRDVGIKGGTAFGAIVGTGLALMTGGASILVSGAAGALIGRLAANKIDLGIKNDRLNEMADALQPGTSAIIAFIEQKWIVQMEQELKDSGAKVMREVLKADIAQQLEMGHDVGFAISSDESGVDVSRMAGDDSEVEIDSLHIGEDGVSASVTIETEDGVLMRDLELTDDGLLISELEVDIE